MQPSIEILERISQNSKRNKDEIFTRLYRLFKRPDIYAAAYGNIYRGKSQLSPDKAISIAGSLSSGDYKPISIKNRAIRRPFEDKLVSEALRMALEAVYEPVLSESSHAFRPGRGCHTALIMALKSFADAKWLMEGGIKGCLSNISHNALIKAVRQKIKDERFLALLQKFLSAGYMEEWRYNATYSGAPQGGVLSPVLSNIFLDGLDKFIGQMSAGLSDGKAIRYIRYADDFIVGVNGSKEDARLVKAGIQAYLSNSLNISFADSRVMHCDEKARFLGYEAEVIKKGAIGSKVALAIPLKAKIERFLLDSKTVKQQGGEYRYSHRPSLINLSEHEIVSRYNAELKGLCEYYRLAANYQKLTYCAHLMEYSCLKTLAAKHKSTITKIMRSHRDGKGGWRVASENGEWLYFAGIASFRAGKAYSDAIYRPRRRLLKPAKSERHI